MRPCYYAFQGVACNLSPYGAITAPVSVGGWLLQASSVYAGCFLRVSAYAFQMIGMAAFYPHCILRIVIFAQNIENRVGLLTKL